MAACRGQSSHRPVLWRIHVREARVCRLCRFGWAVGTCRLGARRGRDRRARPRRPLRVVIYLACA
eukprot:2602318-Prymnesium_polylepis.1